MKFDLFGKKEVVVDQSKEVKKLNDYISKLETQRNDERETHKKEINNLKEDYTIILNRKDAELDVKISESTKILTKDLAKSEAEASNAKKEVEILTKAFENLGFDVKDMKDILNKLVDGIVAKGTIQLVK